MEFTGIKRAVLRFGMISLIFSSVKSTDAGNYYTRTMTTIATEDIVSSMMVKSEISCVLSCQISKTCVIPAIQTKNFVNGRLRDGRQCLHLEKLRKGNISVVIYNNLLGVFS